jgi:predicted Zn finger-like uncharacterized protein
MKVSCPSCDSKYTIADDKVVGKKIKVRCKTCSTQILVDGTVPHEPDDSASEESDPDTWTVNLSESEERKMTTAEIVASSISHQLGDDVFVWKEGMGDWVLVMDVPELRAAIESAKKSTPGASKALGKPAAGAQSPAVPRVAPKPAGTATTATRKSTAPKTGTSVKPPAADPAEEKRGPIVAAPGSALAKKMASAKSAAAAPKVDSAPEHPKEIKSAPEHPKEIKSEPAQKAATRLANKRAQSTHDLFAAVDKAGAEIDVDTSEVEEHDHAKATGARNENSVLFSLDALKSGLGGGGAATRQAAPSQGTPGPRKKAPGPPTKRLEDLMTFEAAPPGVMNAMGGGGLLLSGNDALLTAPAPPPPKPEPKPVPVSTAPGGVVYAAPPRSKLGLIIGIVAGIAIVGTAGAVIALKLASHEPPPAASAELSAKVPAASATLSPSASASASAAPSASEAPSASAPTAVASSTPVPEKVGKVGGGSVARGPSEKPEKKPESKPAEPSGPAISGTFSKDAAVAALSVAASQATVCKKPEGPWGSGKALVTFAPSGRVTTANVTGAPFGGTPVGGCVANVFRRAKIPAFSGDAVTVSKSFTISP